MCGIIGIFNFDSVETNEAQNLKRMCDAIKHRGPDDEGYLLINSKGNFIFKGQESQQINTEETFPPFYPQEELVQAEKIKSSISFGFRRLAIQDLSIYGHQPMSYVSRYWIVYNGEIYNYIELREQLQQFGYKFLSNTDTEVIMASYDYWGKDCVKQFNGMWAFVLYDSKEKQLFISRDRYGIKPLHYYIDKNKIIISSEIKGILQHAGVQTSPNKKYIQDFISSFPKEYIHETSFSNIYRFPKASYLQIDVSKLRNLNDAIEEYYAPEVTDAATSSAAEDIEFLSDKYYSILTDAVRIRLRADVPIGTAFSGGLDSSSVVYIINELLKSQVKQSNQKTFSLVFSNNKELAAYDEKAFIGKLRDHLKLDGYEIEPSLEMVKSEYVQTVIAMEQPQDDMLLSCMFTYKLFRQNGVTVSLDGQGADELQAGYLRYLVNYFSNISILNIYKDLIKYSEMKNALKEIVLGIIFNIVRRLGLKWMVKAILKIFGKYQDPFISVDQRMLSDFQNNLQNLLLFGDRSAMFYSVESRYPFLDFRVVDFWFQLPIHLKLNEGWTKYLARHTFSNKLPSEIVWRKDKMGWEIPQYFWFKKVLEEYAVDQFEKFDFQKVFGIKFNYKKHIRKAGKNAASFKLLIKHFNLIIWYDYFFNNKIHQIK